MDKVNSQAVQNTDKEIWRAVPDDYYADSVFVTEHGGIGMNVGGRVVVKTPRAWLELAWPSNFTLQSNQG